MKLKLALDLAILSSEQIESLSESLSISKAHSVGLIVTLISKSLESFSINSLKATDEIFDLCSLGGDIKITKEDLVSALYKSRFIDKDYSTNEELFFICGGEFFTCNFVSDDPLVELDVLGVYVEIPFCRSSN